MGGHLWVHITAWTFLCSVWVVSANRGLLQDLGLDALPDVTKINISQDEYSRMMRSYLERLQDSSEPNSVPQLITFNSDTNVWRRRRSGEVIRLRFPIRHTGEDVDHAELRLLAPPVTDAPLVRVQIYQILGAHRRRLLEDREQFMSPVDPKWCEFDVTGGVQAWVNGERNLGLEIECLQCKGLFNPLKVAISALVYKKRRQKRRANPQQYFERSQRTACRSNDSKKRCCRHTMSVTFKDLKVPQMGSIIQPKTYEAGFCRGRCPLNYNHATNHSRIQSLVHRLNRRATPRVCCSPSKLAPLDILRVDPYDSTKLSLEKWDNMKVLECACS